MANRIGMDEAEMVEYIIEGIPDPVIRDQARVQRLLTRRALPMAFVEGSAAREESAGDAREREREICAGT